MTREQKIIQCQNCTEKCPQAKMANEIAKGRMYATKAFIDCNKNFGKAMELLAKSVEEIQNLYGRETDLSNEIRDFLLEYE